MFTFRKLLFRNNWLIKLNKRTIAFTLIHQFLGCFCLISLLISKATKWSLLWVLNFWTYLIIVYTRFFNKYFRISMLFNIVFARLYFWRLLNSSLRFCRDSCLSWICCSSILIIIRMTIMWSWIKSYLFFLKHFLSRNLCLLLLDVIWSFWFVHLHKINCLFSIIYLLICVNLFCLENLICWTSRSTRASIFVNISEVTLLTLINDLKVKCFWLWSFRFRLPSKINWIKASKIILLFTHLKVTNKLMVLRWKSIFLKIFRRY